MRLEQLLAEEREGRVKAEEKAKAAEKKLTKEKREMRVELETRQREEVQCETCSIL